jgi:oxygen-independent coproporphyrinogen-3 oxidase
MEERILLRHDRPAPRYTSYPTAPHFTPEVDGPRYRAWLEEIDPTLPLSLYFHIPFCDTLCWFCGCNTTVVRRYDPVANYLGVLLREIEAVGKILGAGRSVRHIHFGGGSPSLLKPDDWRRLFARLAEAFTLGADAEIAIEIDPRDMPEGAVAALAEVGVNRISLGVQDFDPAVQAAINREQPFEVTAGAVEEFRAHGVTKLNMDLMYGLPKQSRAGVAEGVERAIGLAPDRVALFGYAHVPWFKAHQKLIPEKELPDAEERLGQFLAAAQCLETAGYRWIGLDHFARADDGLARAEAAGSLRRNFQGYTDDAAGALIGFGASAIGGLPQGYVQNEAHTPAYLAAIGGGGLAAARGIALSAEDVLRRRIIESLMCQLAVDLDDMCRSSEYTPGDFATEYERLEPLRRDGLVEISGARIAVTEPGRPLLRIVCAAFDTYLTREEGRHSRAV